jgi:protein-S-isoprenylcysteine O-methyltransferase
MTNLLSSPDFLLHLPQYLGDLLGLSELGLALARRSGANTRSEDRGSLYLIWGVMLLSVVASVIAATTVRAADSMLLRQLVPLGILVFVSGLILRWYAIFYLGRFFTVDVAIAADHKVVDTGPYRLIRHPSYTGALLVLLGIGICQRNWLALLLIVVPPTCVLLRRIQIEERALATALGEAYVAYRARTGRLIPFVY